MPKAKRTRLTAGQVIELIDWLREEVKYPSLGESHWTTEDLATEASHCLAFTVPVSTIKTLGLKAGIVFAKGKGKKSWKRGYKIGEVKVEKTLVKELTPEAMEVKVRLSIIVEREEDA